MVHPPDSHRGAPQSSDECPARGGLPGARPAGVTAMVRSLLRIRAMIAAVVLLLAVQPALAQKPVYPATDRAWSSADYRDLNELIKSGKAPLPALADPAGRPVFERMVNLQNLEIG